MAEQAHTKSHLEQSSISEGAHPLSDLHDMQPPTDKSTPSTTEPTIGTKKTVCLGMICKNEAHVIKEALDSVVNYIDYWVINDNGSTDGTQELIRSYFRERGIPGELIDTPWKNFAFNRSEVFRVADSKANYTLVIDADDIWQGPEALPPLEHDSYFLEIMNGSGTRYKRKQIFKNGLQWRYVGVVHEYAESPVARSSATLPDCTVVSRRLGDRNKSGMKYERDISALLEGLQEEPNNARYRFYLAQSYRDNNQPDKAIEHYEKRIEMGGWIEEVFYSYHQIMVCLLRLAPTPDLLEKLILLALKAYRAHPHRAEALYVLTKHCRLTKRYDIGYHFGTMGLSIPYPSQDMLFVGAHIYDHALADETAVCSSWLGKPIETIKLYEQALAGKLLSPSDRARIQTAIEKWQPKTQNQRP